MTRVGKMNFKSVVYLLMFSFFFMSSKSFGEVTVSATVDRNQVEVGGTFTLKVNVSSDESVSGSQPSLPVIANVQLLHNWTSSQSRSTVVSTGQGMDFKTVRSKIYSYQYSVTQKGNIQIDPIGVSVGGKEYQTKAIRIAVVDAGLAQQAPQQRPSRQQQPSNDPIDQLEERFNQLLNRQFGQVPGSGGYMTEPRNDKEAFFILAEVDKTEAYKGEQILASWYLYTRGLVRDIDTLKYPSLKGFWKEDIQISTQLNFEQDVINGIPYKRALLASYALFPIDEGKQSVDAYRAKATITGGFGFGRGFKATKASENIPILIKPLPSEGQPVDFTGAVGEFQMTVDAPNKSIITHQPFPVRIRFEGRGNAKLIELPELPLGETLEVYDIKNESKFFKNGQSFKEFEVLLIPNKAGPLVIDGLRSSFFDPKKGEYVSLQSQPMNLTVLPGTKQQSIGEERLKSDSVKKVLPPIMTDWDPNYKASKSKAYLWPLLFALAILLVIIKAVVDSGVLARTPSLEDLVKIRFVKIERLLSKNQARKVGIESTNTVYLVLGELSGEGGASEELNKMLAKTAPSVRREIEEPLKKLVDYFGVLGFGPEKYVSNFKDFDALKAKTAELKVLLFKACELSKGQVKVEST